VCLGRVGSDGFQLLVVHTVRDTDAEYLYPGILRHIRFDHCLIGLDVRFTVRNQDDQMWDAGS
jgi:hypothetical protein